MPAASFGDALPYFADYAVSIPVGDVSSYLERYRSFQDAKGKLNPYDKALKDKAGRSMAPEQWALHFGIKEVVRAAYQLDGIQQHIVLVRSGRDIPSGSNVYRGNLATLFGRLFDVVDTVCVSLPGHWTVMGSAPATDPFLDKKFLDYPLRERLSDAGLSMPAGIVADHLRGAGLACDGQLRVLQALGRTVVHDGLERAGHRVGRGVGGL